MSRRRTDEVKGNKRDQTVRRDVLSELDDATDRPDVGREEGHYRHPNRDQARGDRDRSRRLDE